MLEYMETKSQTDCKGGNSKPLHNIQQDTKKHYLEREHKKMAKLMGGNNERSDY
jgi:hypothetical protein